MIPAVAQADPADVEKDGGNGAHMVSLSFVCDVSHYSSLCLPQTPWTNAKASIITAHMRCHHKRFLGCGSMVAPILTVFLFALVERKKKHKMKMKYCAAAG